VTTPPQGPATPGPIPRLALLAVALLLPAASLLPLGTLWLWSHGLVVHWAIVMCIAVAGVYALERRLILPPQKVAAAARPTGQAHWGPAQAAAWSAVCQLADRVEPERLSSRDALLGLGLETVETVARRLHPERRDPLLQFTMPEALAVIEQSSANMRAFLRTSIPLGDRVTIAHLMWLYRWRGALQLAEKGYDVWRIVRLLNPVSAATQELRERFTRQVYEAGREHLARRLAAAFVREVGRAAIDLYGGSLRVDREVLQSHVTERSRRDLAAAEAREAEPLRILVAGRRGAGKSSLVHALAGAPDAGAPSLPATSTLTAHRLTLEDVPAALIVDSPGVEAGRDLGALVAAADTCDMVLWVLSAAEASFDLDAAALNAIDEHFAARPDRHPPPKALVLTHVDRLPPAEEWDPPYDLQHAQHAKARAIRGAVQAAAAALRLPPEDVVPVRLNAGSRPYNVDAVWAKLVLLVPEARRARLLRTLTDARSSPGWTSVWRQAVNAGRVLKGTLLTRRRAR